MTTTLLKTISLLCFLVAFAAFAFIGCGRSEGNSSNGGLPSPTKGVTLTTIDCTKYGPEQIRSAIYEALDSNKTYGPQEWQFNITVNGTVIGIIGWSPDHAGIKTLATDTATKCTLDPNINSTFVSNVSNINANFRLGRGCAQGFAPCGDICIPIGQYCKITSDVVNSSGDICSPAAGTPAPSPTQSNSNGKITMANKP